MAWLAAVPGEGSGYGCVSVGYRGSVYEKSPIFDYVEVTGRFNMFGVISADGTQAFVTQTECQADNAKPTTITLGAKGVRFFGQVNNLNTGCVNAVATEISPCDGF